MKIKYLHSFRDKRYYSEWNECPPYAAQKGFINHITGANHFLLLFLDGKKTVVTVHDIMHYFDLHGIKKFIWKLLYIYPLKRAAKVVFISEFSKIQTLKEVKLKNGHLQGRLLEA